MDHLLYGIRREAMESSIREGFVHAIQAYYENYTDEIELSSEVIRAMETLVSWTGLDLDVYQIIYVAERQINSLGGIMSDMDGQKHTVCTRHVWIAVEDEDDDLNF